MKTAVDPKTLTSAEVELLDRYAAKIYAEQPWNGEDARGAYEGGLRLIEARRELLASPPAPVASELPEAVADAIDAITDAYNETDDGYGCAAALEAWARSQTQPVDASAVYDEGFADGVALQKRCEAQPSAVGMTPELEMVLKAASLRCGYLLRGAQTKTKLTESRRLSTAIAALRAKLASMREPLWMLREEHEAETAELRSRLEAE